MFEDWDTALAKHADWVRENYSDRDFSDDYIEGLVDEASYDSSLAVKIFQTLVVILFFGWLGQLIETIIGAPDESIAGIAISSLGIVGAVIIWSKSSPIHERLIRRSIRRRLETDRPND